MYYNIYLYYKIDDYNTENGCNYKIDFVDIKINARAQ